MIPALRHARRVSRATLGLGAVASLAIVAHLAMDAPAGSASTRGQQPPVTTPTSTASAHPQRKAPQRHVRRSHTLKSEPTAQRSTFTPAPPVTAPSATQPTQAQTHSS